MKISFYTLGCKVNLYETSVMVEQCKNNEYEIVDFGDFADVCVINTCTVTNMSDRKSRQIISKAKHINPDCIIVVTGCLAQTAKDELIQLDNIDLIIGNEEKKTIVQCIKKYLEDKNNRIMVQDIMKVDEYKKDEIGFVFEKTRAVMKIQDGCSNYCTYCIIPYARGRIRSKNFNDAINEANNIVQNGYKEIVLTGIHICSYGKDLKENIGLIDLLENLNEIEGLERIRLSSLEPNIITKEFLERLVKLDKVCPHFHLSLQSGCDETLKRMNRKYLTQNIDEIVKMIKRYYSTANITTDIIVGFPGETDEEFNKTKRFFENLNINKMHIFQYSKRKGTAAATMLNQVEDKIKQARSKALIEVSNENEKRFLNSYIDKEINILIETYKDGYSTGFSENYVRSSIKGQFKRNEIVKGKVVDINNNHLMCEKF